VEDVDLAAAAAAAAASSYMQLKLKHAAEIHLGLARQTRYAGLTVQDQHLHQHTGRSRLHTPMSQTLLCYIPK
jgi:hypothetical protein